MEEAMMRAAILVYPMEKGTRTILSFRNLGNDGNTYEVTASNINSESEDKREKISYEKIP